MRVNSVQPIPPYEYRVSTSFGDQVINAIVSVKRLWLLGWRCITVWAFCMLINGATGLGQTTECPESVPFVFCDDFTDGDHADGTPVEWISNLGGQLFVEEGSLLVHGGSLGGAKVSQIELADTSIRARVTLPEGEFIGLETRLNVGAPIDHYFAYIGSDRSAGIGYGTTNSGQVILNDGRIDLDVRSDDVMMQFDVIGNQLSLWAWPPEEGMPGEPIVAVTHDALQVGELGIWVANLSRTGAQEVFRYVQVADSHISDPPFVRGDFDGNGMLDSGDIDALTAQVIAESHHITFDLSGDELVTQEDSRIWVTDLKMTWFGDANLDGEFNSQDFVVVFQRGQYEDGIPGNSTWATGDWNGDGDFVLAFQDGGFERGPRAPAPVPEPVGVVLLLSCACSLVCLRRAVNVSQA